MGNGVRGCEYGRTNRLFIESMKEGQKRIHERLDEIMKGVWVSVGGVALLIIGLILNKVFGVRG
jgi:hypothetical protein